MMSLSELEMMTFCAQQRGKKNLENPCIAAEEKTEISAQMQVSR